MSARSSALDAPDRCDPRPASPPLVAPPGASTAWLAETERDRARVAAFVDPVYLATYRTTPPVADAYAVVERDGAIVACIGLEWPGVDGRLPIERAYRLDRERLPLPLTTERAMQLGRWVSKLPNVGLVAIYAGAALALARGRSIALVEHNDKVHALCERLGLTFFAVPHDGVDLGLIAEKNRACYAAGGMAPYLVELREVCAALAPRIGELSFAAAMPVSARP